MKLECERCPGVKEFILDESVKHLVSEDGEILRWLETVDVKFYCPVCGGEVEIGALLNFEGSKG